MAPETSAESVPLEPAPVNSEPLQQKQVGGPNKAKKRRGIKGTDAVERFTQIKKLFEHHSRNSRLEDREYRRIKKRARNWLVRDWNKEYEDGGGKWRDALSEGLQIELSIMQSDLLEIWQLGDTKNAD